MPKPIIGTPREREIVEWIKQHTGEDWYVKDVRAHLNVSKALLNQLVMKNFGKYPQDLFPKDRLERSEGSLKHAPWESMSDSEIADEWNVRIDSVNNMRRRYGHDHPPHTLGHEHRYRSLLTAASFYEWLKAVHNRSTFTLHLLNEYRETKTNVVPRGWTNSKWVRYRQRRGPGRPCGTFQFTTKFFDDLKTAGVTLEPLKPL